MRTNEEIIQRITARQKQFLSFDVEVLVGALSFGAAVPFLGEEFVADPEAETNWAASSTPTEDAVKEAMRKYMEFAWSKVKGHRGISADRSVQKLTAWVWLLGDDKTLSEIEKASYTNYGAPKLAAICKAYGFPIPNDPGVKRMIRSKSCGADYRCGCGR